MVSVYVERDSQKPIIIGRGAEHLVRVRRRSCAPRSTASSDGKAKLDLHVKVAKGWQSGPQAAGEARLLICAPRLARWLPDRKRRGRRVVPRNNNACR